MRGILLLLIICCVALQTSAQAGRPSKRKIPSWLPQPPARPVRDTIKLPFRQAYKPVGKKHVLTVNFPGLMVMQKWLLGGPGIEYERFIDKDGMLSLGLSAYAALTVAMCKGQCPNINSFYAVPAILYHPSGNRQLVDVSAGLGLAVGYLRREVSDHIGYPPGYLEKNFMTALLGQLNLTLHHRNAFVLGGHLSAGALLSPDHRGRLMIQAGLKFGGRFQGM